MQSVNVRFKADPVSYHISIGSALLPKLGEVVSASLPRAPRKVALVSNKKVFDLYGAESLQSLRRSGFDVKPWFIGDGERYKSHKTLLATLAFLENAGFERNDVVVALGGGVVGDLAGFASAIYLRGLGLIQVPTTLLSQIDSSVGGKTAVNTRAGKNLIGAFHQPRAVLIDTDTLKSLSGRDLTAGWCEAVKQGAAGDRALFDRTFGFLSSSATRKSSAELGGIIAAQCAFKASIVAGDERESLERSDNRSRRILNFGHTTGHAIEAVTSYRRFRHGEAVGLGMIVAGEISRGLGLLDPSELELLKEAVRACGRLPGADDLDPGRVLAKLALDKKSVGGRVNWILLNRIGRAAIVDGGEISPKLLRASLRTAFRWK